MYPYHGYGSQHEAGSWTHAPPPPPAGYLGRAFGGLSPGSRHNTIHDLPNELLIKIFYELLPISYLWPVMKVCRAWRSIIAGTPAFWRAIVVGAHLDWLGLCLERSQQLPVSVHLDDGTTEIYSALRMMVPHRHRVAALQLWLDCAKIGDHLHLEDMADWGLRELTISVNHEQHAPDARWHNGMCPTLLLQFPKLEELTLNGLTLQTHGLRQVPTPQTFSGLKSIRLEGYIGAHKTHKLSDFLAMLKACTSLTSLSMESPAFWSIQCDLPQASSDNTGSNNIVALPHLTTLTVHGQTEEVATFVSYLDLPLQVDMMLGTEEMRDVRRASLAARAILPRDLGRCKLPILSNITRVKVDVSRHGDDEGMIITGTVSSDHEAGKISIVVRFPQVDLQRGTGAYTEEARAEYYRRALALLPSIFPGARVNTLVCRGDLAAISEEAMWRWILSRYPLVRTLVVEDYFECGDARPLFRALASPHPSTVQGRQVPMCPFLEYLWVRNLPASQEQFEEIRRCIAWRTAASGGLRMKRLRLEMILEGRDHSIGLCQDMAATYRAQLTQFVVETSLLVLWPDYDSLAEQEDFRDYDSERELPFHISYF